MDQVIILRGSQLNAFLAYMEDVRRMDSTGFGVHTLRVAIDEGSVKIKVNNGGWTRPLGEVDE